MRSVRAWSLSKLENMVIVFCLFVCFFNKENVAAVHQLSSKDVIRRTIAELAEKFDGWPNAVHWFVDFLDG